MGPSTESLALADYLISKLGLQVDRISLAYAIMDHVEVEYADELAQPSPGGQGVDPGRVAVEFIAAANFDVPDGYVVEEHLPGIWHYTYTDAGEKMASCASWNNKAHATIAAWQAALAARQPVGEVSVKKEDANNYCLILRALGMEEEGDPVAEVKALIDARDRQPVGEPIGWYTEDHLTDRSATTYDRTVADRWRAKGWPVYPLYGAPPVLFKELQKLRELQAMIGGQADAHG